MCQNNSLLQLFLLITDNYTKNKLHIYKNSPYSILYRAFLYYQIIC